MIHNDITLETYAFKTGCEGESKEIWAIDLLSGLKHMCELDELYFDDFLRIAGNHYQSETGHIGEDC